ncbi:hypothetical protein M422DRAFT_785610 [Sphaerobolus stellatus SS14]|uniref:Uncharacterized protein n=1 Tax=Sphaerobolus stellatus (strain SS14) TaxID=990650 RepID=A0A0C9UJD0_SPHS4|nr:hypothetical protein M422DRAFT_785610 [Sphaerobolus stellatus SS14]
MPTCCIINSSTVFDHLALFVGKQLNQTPRSKNPPTLSINPESESTTKINELKSRIKELEDALGTLQTIHGRDTSLLNEEEEDQDVDDLNEMLGTLKVDRDSGSTHFFGHPGGIEVHFHLIII